MGLDLVRIVLVIGHAEMISHKSINRHQITEAVARGTLKVTLTQMWLFSRWNLEQRMWIPVKT
ncbi:hypothetical protein SAMN06266787_11413 [Halorubrum ezzemoulense]|uniref:Uncharacterized protein n=1 Tax=Halorubrum ezzemoulense TaxID=337243 RepID=A0A238YMF5_HALEZ|nr:hypothetical protein SAMN06266787_11413 [Halorubrum ezzemoulense]